MLSKGRAEQLKEYAKKRKAYIKEHPICEACGKRKTDHIHHKKFRFGKLLCDERWFMSVCFLCHHWITNHAKQAEQKGWIIRDWRTNPGLKNE